VVAIAIAYLVYEEVDSTLLFAWLACALTISALRLLVYRGFPDNRDQGFDVRVWQRRFDILSLLSGGTFGLLPVLFINPENFVITAWIIIITTGLAGGALGTLSAYSRAFALYIAASVGPMVVVLTLYGSDSAYREYIVIAILFVLVGVFFLRFSRRFERALVDQIKGRLENVDLAQRMTQQGAVLRSVMQAIPNAIAVVEGGGRIVYRNERFHRLFDVPEDLFESALTSKTFNAYRQARGDFDHLDLPAMRAQTEYWDRLAETGEAFGYVRTLRDGRVLRVENHPMTGGGWVRSWTDITEEKAAQEETDRWSHLLQLTLDHIDQGMSFIDRDGNQIMANRRYCEMLGLPDEYMRRTIPLDDIVAELTARGELDDIPPEMTDAISRWERGEDPSTRLIYERRQSNGNWLMVSANRLPEGGHVRTFTDITDRKLAEISAAERSELLETTLASIDQGVIMRDAEDNVLLFNDRLATLLDVPREMYANNTSSTELYAYHDQQEDYALEAEVEARIYEWSDRRRQGLPVERLEYQRQGPGGAGFTSCSSRCRTGGRSEPSRISPTCVWPRTNSSSRSSSWKPCWARWNRAYS
jgi:PAS domain-containing protein